MKRAGILLTLMGARVALFSFERPPVPNAFIDCARATGDYESVVCTNEFIRTQDFHLSFRIQKLLEVSPEPARAGIQKEQSNWLEERKARCTGERTAIEKCVDEMHRRRWEQLDEAYSRARCPKVDLQVQSSCREVGIAGVPAPVQKMMNRELGRPVAYAVDLNQDGSLEYEFCESFFPHGPCSALIVGQVGGQWKTLGSLPSWYASDKPCPDFLVLEEKHEGFHDLCVLIDDYRVRSFRNSAYGYRDGSVN